MTATARLLRAGAAATTMAVILVGLPVALWVLGSPLLPDHLPDWQEMLGALTSRDDGRLFLACLVLLGFLAWVMLSTSVLAELAAALRGRTAAPITLPGFRLSQAFAAALVAAVISAAASPATALAAAPVSISVLAPPHAHPLASTALGGDAPPQPQRDTPADRGGPVYHVQDRDTLWDIAERTLGDPLRWREILALNLDRPQPDGHHLTEDTILHVGWLLRLPAGAVIPDDEADNGGVVTVEPGDTVREIARDRLGSASRYVEIEDLNAGRCQPDGDVLRDPDLIRPGRILQLPTRTDAPAQPPSLTPPRPSPEPADPDDSSSRSAPPPPDTPGTRVPADAEPSPPTRPDQPTAPDADATSAALPTALTLSALLASGLLGGLAAHRRRQRTPRRQLPVPDQQTARLEWAAHTVTARADTTFLDRALRCLAATLADTAGTVAAEPDVLAVWLAPPGCGWSSPNPAHRSPPSPHQTTTPRPGYCPPTPRFRSAPTSPPTTPRRCPP